MNQYVTGAVIKELREKKQLTQAELAEKLGVSDKSVSRWENGRTMMEMLAENMDPKYTSFVLDTYWVQHGGGDVRYWIEKLSGRIDILHLKDMMVLKREDGTRYQNYTEIGQGNLYWQGIMEAAEKAGVRYYVVEQDTCPGDPFESLKISSDYIHRNFM